MSKLLKERWNKLAFHKTAIQETSTEALREGYEESIPADVEYNPMGEFEASQQMDTFDTAASCIDINPEQLMAMVCELFKANPINSITYCDLVVAYMAKDETGLGEYLEKILECPICEEICRRYCEI